MPHERLHHTNLAVVIFRGDSIIFQICSSSPWRLWKIWGDGSWETNFTKEGMKLNKWLTPKNIFLGGMDIFQNNKLLNEPKMYTLQKYFVKSMNPTLQFSWDIMHVVVVRSFLSLLYLCYSFSFFYYFILGPTVHAIWNVIGMCGTTATTKMVIHLKCIIYLKNKSFKKINMLI